MKLTFLGTGTSTGVPTLGCQCPVCTSADARDKRLRTSAILDADDGSRLLIDCGPDFRTQMLRCDHRPLSGVLITHNHYDHVGGLDDLRPFCRYGAVRVYASPSCCATLRQRMAYCFGPHRYPGTPQFEFHEMPLYAPAETEVRIGPFGVQPVTVEHGVLPILGYRIGQLGYITDMKDIRPTELAKLRGVETLVVNGLRAAPHPSHQTVAEAVALARSLGVHRAYLVHMSHEAGLHACLQQQLPQGVDVAYDGLEVEV